MSKPALHEIDSLDQVIEPGSKRLQRRVGYNFPVWRHLAVLEAEVHLVELTRHEDDTVDGLIKVSKALAHGSQEPVELLHLLKQDSCERG